MKKRFKPNPKQIIGRKILHNSENTDILFDGGKRAGKTVLICYDFLELSCRPEFTGIRQLIVREKFNHLKLSVYLQTFKPLIDKYFTDLFYINKSDYIITNKFTNNEIWLAGIDDKERSEKIFGQEYARIFVNEAVQISPHSCQKLESILAQNIKGFINQIIYDCNPRSPAHWIYKKFYLEKIKGHIKLTWTPYDNKENLPKAYFKRLENLSGTERKRYLDGEWCEVEGALYRNVFERNKINASKNWADYDYVIGGIDWGYHAAVVIWGIKEEMAVCIYDYSPVGGRTKQIIDFLNSIPWLKENVTFYCDHEIDRIDELCDCGYIAKKAYKEVSAGDGTVNEYELWFDNKCEATFQSMLNLMREQDKDGYYTDRHVKINDHEADASRYALHSSFMKMGGESANHFLKKKVL